MWSSQDAAALFEDSSFEESIAAAHAELRAGRLDPKGVTQRHFLLGRAYAAVGNGERSMQSFARALSLDPGLALPPDSSPKIVELYQAAVRQAAGAPPMSLHAAPGKAAPGTLPILRVRAESDSAGLVTRFRLSARAPGQGWREAIVATSAGAAEVDLSTFSGRPVPLELRVDALDAYGNVLASLSTENNPLLILPAPVPIAPRQPAPETMVARAGSPWWLWPAVIGAVLAVGGGAALLVTRGGGSEQGVPLELRPVLR